MYLKDHQQKSSWASKRAQRCLSIALTFVIILVLGLTSQASFPRKAELKLSKVRPYSYGSSPEAGRPSIPFQDNSARISNEAPVYDVPYYDEQ